MTNGSIPERGEYEWKVGEKTYVLVLPLRQLRALDKELSTGGVIKMMGPTGRGIFDASIEDVEKILRYGLQGGGTKMDAEEFEKIWDQIGLNDILTACDQLLLMTLKGATKPGKEEAQTKDPLPATPDSTPPSSASPGTGG